MFRYWRSYSAFDLVNVQSGLGKLKPYSNEQMMDLTSSVLGCSVRFGSAVFNLFESMGDNDRYIAHEGDGSFKRLSGHDVSFFINGQVNIFDKQESTLWYFQVGTPHSFSKGSGPRISDLLNICALFFSRNKYADGYSVRHLKSLFLVSDHRVTEHPQQSTDASISKVYVNEHPLLPQYAVDNLIYDRIRLLEEYRINSIPDEPWDFENRFAVRSNYKTTPHQLIKTEQEAYEWIEENKWELHPKTKEIMGHQFWYGKTWIEDTHANNGRLLSMMKYQEQIKKDGFGWHGIR